MATGTPSSASRFFDLVVPSLDAPDIHISVTVTTDKENHPPKWGQFKVVFASAGLATWCNNKVTFAATSSSTPEVHYTLVEIDHHCKDVGITYWREFINTPRQNPRGPALAKCFVGVESQIPCRHRDFYAKVAGVAPTVVSYLDKYVHGEPSYTCRRTPS